MHKKKRWKTAVAAGIAALGLIFSVRPAMAAPQTSVLTLEDSTAGEDGYQAEQWVKEDGTIVEDSSGLSEKEEETLLTETEIPESYDLRTDDKMTSVKNQGISGSCWAFASLGSIESNLLMKNAPNAELNDFSEAHLVWFGLSYLDQNVQSPTYGDGRNNNAPYKAGGNWLIASATIASGRGPANEADYPFDPSDLSAMGNYTDTEKDQQSVYLKDASVFPNGCDQKLLKQAIMEKGALMAGYFNAASCFYNNEETSQMSYFHAATDTTENHAILICGWDDNYAVENFKEGTRPENKGAWLVKNSWGSDWGMDGYFWMSYEEGSLKTLSSFDVVPESPYENRYEYDANSYNKLLGSDDKISAANIFTSNQEENLEAVSFYTSQANVDYTIFIYDKTGTMKEPTDGTLLYYESGNVPYRGYHQIALKEKVKLFKGEQFSVIIQVKCQDTSEKYSYFPFEGSSYSNLKIYYGSRSGESYVKFGALSSSADWKQTEQYAEESSTISELHNACIKAFTNPASSQSEDLKTELEELLSEQIEEQKYTPDTLAAYQEAFTAAKELLETQEENERAYINALKAFKDAKAALKEKVMISTVEQWNDYAVKIQNLQNSVGDYVELTADLDFAGSEAQPIGKMYYDSAGSLKARGFHGTLDGAGFTIQNAQFGNSDTLAAGAVAYLCADGIVKNLTLENIKANGTRYAAGICAYQLGAVENCNVLGTSEITSEEKFAGGISAYVSAGTINNVAVQGTIHGKENTGGIAGFLTKSTVAYAANEAQVTGTNYTGGVCGYLMRSSAVEYSENKGIVTGENYVGGIAGMDYAAADALSAVSSLSYSSNRGTVHGTDIVGGVIGEHYNGTITACDHIGSVEVTAENASVGGVVGVVKTSSGSIASITDCYAAGTVTETGNSGSFFGTQDNLKCQNNYTAVLPQKEENFQDGIQKITSEQVSNGELAYLMNNGNKSSENLAWMQENNAPKFTEDAKKAVVLLKIKEPVAKQLLSVNGKTLTAEQTEDGIYETNYYFNGTEPLQFTVAKSVDYSSRYVLPKQLFTDQEEDVTMIDGVLSVKDAAIQMPSEDVNITASYELNTNGENLLSQNIEATEENPAEETVIWTVKEPAKQIKTVSITKMLQGTKEEIPVKGTYETSVSFTENGTYEITYHLCDADGIESAIQTKVVVISKKEDSKPVDPAPSDPPVVTPTVRKIAIAKKPSKLTFTYKSKVNTSGLKLKVTYSNGTVKTIASGFTTSYDFSKSGKRKVVITYQKKSVSYYVTVAEQVIKVGKSNISKIKYKKAKKFEVTIKRVSKAAGYQLAYSTSKKFKKSATKTVTLKKTKTILKKINPKKYYYIRVRAFRYKDNGKKVYGKWSTVKKKKA